MSQNQNYQTKNKKRIWEFVLTQKDTQFSANDVYRHFMAGDKSISMPTIYRQLDKLTEQGSLQKYRTGESDTAFYYYVGEGEGDHLQPLMKCTACGQTIPLKCHAVERLADHVRTEHHFYIELGNTTLYGKCAQCMAPQHK